MQIEHVLISPNIDVIIFNAAPESLNHSIIQVTTFPIHKDAHTVPLQDTCERFAGKLAPLVRVENFRSAIACQGFFECLDAKVGIQRVG